MDAWETFMCSRTGDLLWIRMDSKVVLRLFEKFGCELFKAPLLFSGQFLTNWERPLADSCLALLLLIFGAKGLGLRVLYSSLLSHSGLRFLNTHKISRRWMEASQVLVINSPRIPVDAGQMYKPRCLLKIQSKWSLSRSADGNAIVFLRFKP